MVNPSPHGWPEASRSPAQQSGEWPGNFLPHDVGAWPRGRRSFSEAESLLASAEALWDVGRSGFRAGDRILRNLGTAGACLDLTLAGDRTGPNSGDPSLVAPEDVPYIWSPGGSNLIYIVTANTPPSVPGDVDVMTYVAPDQWRPSTTRYFLRKGASNTGTEYSLYTGSTNRLTFSCAVAGTARSAVSDADLPSSFVDGQGGWIRTTKRASDGKVKFYTSTDAPDVPPASVSWTQIGSDRALPVTGSADANTNALFLNAASTTSGFPGKWYATFIRDGFDGAGSVVLDVNAANFAANPAGTTATPTVGSTVSLFRTTSGPKLVLVPARSSGGVSRLLFGTDDFLEATHPAQHRFLNFGAWDSFTILTAFRAWATSPSASTILGKGAATSLPSWGVGSPSATQRFRLAVFTSAGLTPSADSATYADGLHMTGVAVNVPRSGDSRASTVYANGAGLVTVSPTVMEPNPWPFRIGLRSDMSGVFHGEFFAAAIWRRALTPAQIQTLTDARLWGT
jgi:hypothetical protein